MLEAITAQSEEGPTYEYACEECGAEWESEEPADTASVSCPECDSTAVEWDVTSVWS